MPCVPGRRLRDQGSGTSPESPPEAKRGLLGSRWLKWITYAIAAAALTYVLWNLHLSDLREGISQMIWWPVAVSIVLQIAPRVVQAWRWGYLLRPARVRFRLLLHAIYVSTLMNGILPLCPSDVVRGIMVARRTRTGTVTVFSTQIVERVADGAALALVAWLALRSLPVPAALNQALFALVGLVAVGILIGLVVKLRHRQLHGFVSPREPRGRMGKAMKASFLEMLAGAKSVRLWTLPLSVSAGLGMLVMQVVTMWLMLYAYRIDLSLIEAAGLLGIITIGTLLPNAPGKIGAWQFFCILGLGLLGTPASQAAGFSLIAFAIWTVPSLLGGVLALILSPISWSELRPGAKPVIPGTQPA